MKDSVRLLLAVTASNSCSLNSIDIKTAFLRGNPKERELCLRPSKEANQSEKTMASFESSLWTLRRLTHLRVQGECSS